MGVTFEWLKKIYIKEGRYKISRSYSLWFPKTSSELQKMETQITQAFKTSQDQCHINGHVDRNPRATIKN